MMNNEPVAWMSEFGQFIGKVQDEICHIPLYTHPVKKLTDEEILKIILKYESESGDNTTYDVLSCIREIIRKAQEK